MNAALAAPLGLLIGSFLNVVAYRLPRGESLLWPASHCPGCDAADQALRQRAGPVVAAPARQVPQLRRSSISPRYPAIELLTGARVRRDRPA